MKNIPFIQKTGLFYKIASLVVLTLIIAIGVSTTVSIREQTKTITTELIEKNKTISKHLASSVKNAFWSLNWLFVEKQVQEITKSEDVTFLELIKPNGEVYLSSGDKELEENVLPPLLMNSEKQILKDVLSPKTGRSIKLIITPLKIGSDKWTLIIGLSLKEVEEAKKRILKNNIIWGSTIFLLGVLVSFWLARGLTRPIKQLVEGTKEIGKGNLDYRINIKGLDELGTLADSFNDMAKDLKKTTTSRDQLAIEVNERKQVEEALRESEEKYRTVLEASPDPVIVYDMKGKVIYFNPAFTALFGWTLEERLGKKMDVFVPEEAWPETKTMIDKVLAGDSFSGIETRRFTKEGKIIPVNISGAIYRGQENNPVGSVINLRDISEQKRLEAQLQRAQKMEAIGTLAGGVAHDLNNILAGLVSYPDLLLLDIPEDNPLRNSILTIQSSGQKAAVIVQDLLTLARRGVAVTEVVDLNHIICEYLEGPEHEKLKSFHPKVIVDTNFETDLLNILGSPVHLSKTIMNLISNAAEAMPDGGRVLISTENRYLDRPIRGYDYVEEGDYVVLKVSDTGVGISPEDMEKIFEPFYTKKVMGRSGTGLGMAVVWGTVKDHNGYINVESAAGKRTTFTIYFPVTRKEIKDTSSTPFESLIGNGESILVVDDVEEQRSIASNTLTKLGYVVDTVSSGEEAVEYLKERNVDLIVLDMIMDPGIDGLDTYKKILELHPGQKAIIASGFSETERVKEAHRLGVGQYIRKPYTLEKIGLSVKNELEK